MLPFKNQKGRVMALPPPLPSLHQTFLHLLHHHPSPTLPHLKSLHAFAVTSGLLLLSSSPSSLLTSLLSHFPLLSPLPPPSSISYPLSLFHQIPTKSTYSFNLIIRAHALLSLPLPALRLFLRLRRLPLAPDSHTFPFTLKACSLLPPSSLPLGRSLHCQALLFGFASDLFVTNTLISMYSSFESVDDDAYRIFVLGPCRDVVSYNVLIDGYVKAGRMDVARELFDKMPHRDVVSWGTVLAGYAKGDGYMEGIRLFERMLAAGFRPDDVALISVLSCSAQLGALDRGRAIHEYIRRNRVKLNVYLSTGLVDMYAKCGCIGSAVEVFEASPRKNLFTWNAIVVGVAVHGHGELAVEYFERMRKEGVRPDGVSFLGVLVGCSHAGLTDMAKRLFDEMESVYGVERELKHYGCMADLLGRAGLISEAMEMIERMPMKADAYVWGGVLGGCRIHGNVEVAEIATRHLLEINGEDSGIYSIMADIYFMAGRREDVERMRKLTNGGKVKKNVACSLIEVGSFGHGLVAG